MIGYEQPVRMTAGVTARRIFSPLAYRCVRRTSVVPVVMPEAWALASWFPIVWKQTDRTYQLVAVRSLYDDGRGYLPAVERNPGLLPLLLHAYPFLLDPQTPPTAGDARLIDDVMADMPTDAGSPILLADQRPARATRLRLGMLDLFAKNHLAASDLSDSLAEVDLFEPWKLSFDINGQDVGVSGLFIVKQASFATGVLAPIMARHGIGAAQLLALHRISLFRAGSLLLAARASASASKAAATQNPEPGAAKSGAGA